MTRSIDQLRRDARVLRKAFEARESTALQRIAAEAPRVAGVALNHADYLDVIAWEKGFASRPAHHQAARQMRGAEIVALLVDAAARVYGSRAPAEALEARGQGHLPDGPVARLAAAAEGGVPAETSVNPDTRPGAAGPLLQKLLRLTGRLDHVKRLVAPGLEHDRQEAEGLTPLQVAGWEGAPETMGNLLAVRPDLTRLNGYVGTLPHQAIVFAGEPEVADFVADRAEAHPARFVDGGPT